MPTKRYKRAQKATALELLGAISQSPPHDLVISVHHAADLSHNQRDDVFTMFAGNMQELYMKSPSFGWQPEQKKEELFHKHSRFVLLTSDGKLRAYTMFRFDAEESLDVLYCYELQVCPDAKRQGLGRYLVNALLALATNWQMDSVMLTVQRENTQAAQFYRALGFEVDPSSPTFFDQDDSDPDAGIENSDYEILSIQTKPQRSE